MKANLRRVVSGAFVLIVGTAILQPFHGDAASGTNRESKLHGTWRVHMTPRNCQTGVPAPPFDFLVTFARGGTLTEVINAAAFLPGQRTAGLGVWSRTSRNAYKANSEAFILVDSPTIPVIKQGSQRLAWDIIVDRDSASIEAGGQFVDMNGNVLAATCASGTATRFEGEQDED